MANKLEKKLKEASKAYQKGDRKKGARLAEEILKVDFNHPGVWLLLHQQYGRGTSFEPFRQSFAQKHYPALAGLLMPLEVESGPEPAPKKSSFFERLFRRKKKEPEADLTPPSFLAALPAEPTSDLPVSPHSDPPPASKPDLSPPSRPRPEPQPSPSGVTAFGRPSMLKQTGSLISTEIATAPSTPSKPFDSDDKIRVLVVDDTAETRENIIRLMRFESNIEVVGTARTGSDGILAARELKPDVILMDVNMPDMDGITATSIIHKEMPITQILILTVQDDVDYIRKAMQAGARDFLAKPPTIDQLVNAVLRAGELAHREKAKIPVSIPMMPASLPVRLAARGKVISVYSPKGGVGCTTLAVNLAVSLQNEETAVTLVDGNLQFGDVTILFNEQARNSVVDLASHASELDPEIVENVLLQHKSGVRLLPAPKPEKAEAVTGEDFGAMLKYLRELYPYVVVDTYHELSDVTFAAFDASDLVILVVTQDIPCIGNVRKFLDLSPMINLNRQKVLLVMNAYDKRIAISPEKVSQNFQQEIAAIIPLDSPIVVPSINRGVPFMLQKDAQARPVGRAMLELARTVRTRLAGMEEERLLAEAADIAMR